MAILFRRVFATAIAVACAVVVIGLISSTTGFELAGSSAALATASKIDSPGKADVRDCITGTTTTCRPTSKGPLVTGTTVSMKCWAFGDTASGKYSSDKWFWSEVTSGPKIRSVGWIHSSWVINQSRVGRCGGEVPSLGTDNYDGKNASCATVISGKYCKDGSYKLGSFYSRRGYAWRNCTDFAAFRMGIPAGWGNAATWDDGARRDLIHWAIDTNPHVGDVSQSDANVYGHVAVVIEVAAGRVRLEEYNGGAIYPNKVYYGDGAYSKSRWVPTGGLEFIRRIRS